MKLWLETGVRVLPGAYLSRDAGGVEPRQGIYPGRDGGPNRRDGAGLIIRLRDCLY